MGPVAVAALGAGAFVTTAAAGVVLLRRKFFGNAVEVDLEKGLEENAMERREGTGPGWKEYIEVDEKTSDLLVPLVGAFQSREEKDVTDANPFQALHTPELPLPALHQCPDLCTPTARQQIEPILVVEGDISETHYGDHAPAFPPGLPVPAKAVAVNRPISARSSPLLGLGPLDTGMTGITSWPVLAPTPVEEMRAKVNGQGVQVESDIKDDVVSQDVPATSGLESASDLEIPPNPGLPASSGLISESDEVDPFADPADLILSPRFEASLDVEGSVSPTCIPPSIANSLDDPDPQPGGVGWPDTTDSISATSNLCLCPSVAILDPVFPVNIPLPESQPTSPTSVSPLLIHPLPPDTIATTTVTFGEPLPLSEDVSDQDLSSPVIIAPTVPILAPIVTSLYLGEGVNEAPRSPLSDTSSSGSESWGPETPTELKQDLPFSPVLDISSKDTPRLQLPVCLPSEEGMVVDDEDIEVIDDFVMVGQQMPDPPSPTIDIIAPEWTASKLPGSFEVFTASTSSRDSPGQKSAGTTVLADVPPLTADMIQFCHALLAVSNCAGLVAQAVVGFSVWWSLMLVPA